jgi:hypothetical protein
MAEAAIYFISLQPMFRLEGLVGRSRSMRQTGCGAKQTPGLGGMPGAGGEIYRSAISCELRENSLARSTPARGDTRGDSLVAVGGVEFPPAPIHRCSIALAGAQPSTAAFVGLKIRRTSASRVGQFSDTRRKVTCTCLLRLDRLISDQASSGADFSGRETAKGVGVSEATVRRLLRSSRDSDMSMIAHAACDS